MEKEELERRIAKKESDIAKIEKRIAKWTEAQSEEKFAKDQGAWYAEDGKKFTTFTQVADARNKWCGGRETLEQSQQRIQNDYLGYLKNCENELRYATRDLEEAKLTLEKYRNALLLKQDQERVEKIQVIVDFLNLWKERVTEWVYTEAKQMKAAYEFDSEICQKHNSGWYRDHPEADERADYRTYRAMMDDISPLTKLVYNRRAEGYVDHEKLDQELAKEAEAKYFKLVDQVTKYTGPITDASDLRIGQKGDLNGVVVGENGKARVQTIGAGGYNTGMIVNVKHGQCYHYRTLVDPIK